MAQFENIYDIDLSLRRKDSKPLLQPIGEGDAKGLRVGARVFSGGESVSLGGQCVGKVIRADGATVPLTGTVSGNVASVVLDQQSCAVEGPIQVAVMWVSGTNITTLVIAYGTVVNTQTGNAIQPSTPIPDLTQLLAEIDAMRTATAAANAAAEKSVRYDTAQTLSTAQKTTARGNIDAVSTSQAVRFDEAQSLTDANKATARGNIGAAGVAELNALDGRLSRSEAVIYETEQYDYTRISTETYPTGWRTGYYNIRTGEGSSSSVYIRTRAAIADVPDNTLYIRAKAPEGYYIGVVEYAADGTTWVGHHGNMNPNDVELPPTAEVVFAHTPSHAYRVSVGRFSNYDAAAYAADAEFIGGIVFELYASPVTASVRYDAAQALTDAQKARALENIGGASVADCERVAEDCGRIDALMPRRVAEVSAIFAENCFWNTQGSQATLAEYTGHYWAGDPIEVEPGQRYRVAMLAGNSAKSNPVVIVDGDMNILEVTDRPTTSGKAVSVEVEIPDGGRYMLLTKYYENAAAVRRIARVPAEPKYALLEGKTVAIIGDSISTNGDGGANPNVPEIVVTEADVGVELNAWLTYYDVQGGLSLGGHTYTSAEIGTKVTFTPTAEDVGKAIGKPNNYNPDSTTVWWEVAMEELGFTPIPVCWSGSSITSHEDGAANRKASYAWHEAQIRKCGIRTPGTMDRSEPDMVIVYRGTNDFSHAPYALLTDGYFDDYDWQYPEDDGVDGGGYGYKEGLCLTVKALREAYPNAKIFLCTLNVFKRVNYGHWPTNNGVNSLPQYNAAIREVADFMGCGLIAFDRDGITFENCYAQGYITDSRTTPTHPSDKGHRAMGLKAITDIRAQYSNMA